jgi:hypothetical protein
MHVRIKLDVNLDVEHESSIKFKKDAMPAWQNKKDAKKTHLFLPTLLCSPTEIISGCKTHHSNRSDVVSNIPCLIRAMNIPRLSFSCILSHF